jgi:hypothetical protein
MHYERHSDMTLACVMYVWLLSVKVSKFSVQKPILLTTGSRVPFQKQILPWLLKKTQHFMERKGVLSHVTARKGKLKYTQWNSHTKKHELLNTFCYQVSLPNAEGRYTTCYLPLVLVISLSMLFKRSKTRGIGLVLLSPCKRVTGVRYSRFPPIRGGTDCIYEHFTNNKATDSDTQC